MLKMLESYLNKRIAVPYTCRNGAYPDPERNKNISHTQGNWLQGREKITLVPY